ncbi:MAG TPA: mechanosensitive ion channel domain-containing protein [Caulobacteraceae bacterium]|nr:mechanosensitive ion channel domain-containing protein [Caulobacteraceae bacterium]
MAEPTTLATSIQNTLNGETVAIAKLSDLVGDLAVNLTVSILIMTLAVWLSGWASQLVRRGIERIPRINQDRTLADFASSFARYVVVVIGIIAVLRRLGVETTSIITVLGAASLAVGLALQGTLSNVAAGVMVLIFRPYRVGDQVTLAGKTGMVKHFDLFNTELRDLDNLKIVVPNGKAFGDVVVNYTDISARRIELTFGIGYEDDIGTAVRVATGCAAADARILPDPAPWAKVTELAASTVNVTLRCWTAPTGYQDTRFDLLRRVKEAFDAAGISLPYPTQVTVERRVDPDGAPVRPH